MSSAESGDITSITQLLRHQALQLPVRETVEANMRSWCHATGSPSNSDDDAWCIMLKRAAAKQEEAEKKGGASAAAASQQQHVDDAADAQTKRARLSSQQDETLLDAALHCKLSTIMTCAAKDPTCVPEATCASGETALHKACTVMSREEAMMWHLPDDQQAMQLQMLLLMRGANPWSSSGPSSQMPSKQDRLAVIRWLLRKGGANPDARDNHGLTALHGACQQNLPPMVRLLLAEGGANPDVQDTDGNTPLMYGLKAGKYFDLDLVKLLVAHGADASVRNKQGKTAAHLAFYRDGVVEWLIAARDGPKVDVNACDNMGNSVLADATAGGLDDLVQLLVSQADVDVNIANKAGETPLHRAARMDRTKAARTLIKAGAAVNAKSKKGDVPLHLAVRLDSQYEEEDYEDEDGNEV